MNRSARGAVAVSLVLSAWICWSSTAHAGNWPQWRGPQGTSVSDATGLPVRWGEQQGIAWKTKLPEWGTSTPAIWGDAIFVTSHEEDRLLLLRIDKSTGRIAWTRQIGSGEATRMPLRKKDESERAHQKFHRLHNLASPSPVTDGTNVIVHFGNGDLAAYDFAGRRLWQRNLQADHGGYTIWWGHANSPVLCGDLVMSVCMQDSLADVAGERAPSYIVAHDKQTGAQRWLTPRMTQADAEQCDAYTTPVLRERDGRAELVVMGGNQLDAYDPRSGEQIWRLPGLVGGRTVTGPTLARDLVFATRGMKGPLLAVRGGRGELDDAAIVWKYEQGTPDTCCPVVWEKLLFMISDNGIAQCLDAQSGELRWRERFTGDYKASPVAADGRVYFVNTTGTCTVVAASSRFERLAENQVEDETIASPALSDGRIYLRGRKSLYCIGE